MSTIKAALAGVFAWLDKTWAKHGAAAILAFLIGAALMMALEARR